MFQIYLPIAEMSVNIALILSLGVAVGFLSGLFGVGGGFLLTPLLMLVGITPAVAVATQANQIIASSVSGVIAHWQRGNVDIRMGGVLLAGGLIGSGFGVWLFGLLRELGQIDLVISLCYVVFLGVIGGLMAVESTRAILRHHRQSRGRAPVRRRKKHLHSWGHKLPLRMRFPHSGLYMSALLPGFVGMFVGMLSAIMGVGGGFVMVPAMIYILGMPTQTVIGTSLFQIIFVAANVTFLQSVNTQTVDVMLALLLMIGSVVGAQFGAGAGAKLRGEQLRVLLAAMVLAVCLKLGIDLVVEPAELYSIRTFSA